jgi:hypothetical protein
MSAGYSDQSLPWGCCGVPVFENADGGDEALQSIVWA